MGTCNWYIRWGKEGYRSAETMGSLCDGQDRSERSTNVLRNVSDAWEGRHRRGGHKMCATAERAVGHRAGNKGGMADGVRVASLL